MVKLSTRANSWRRRIFHNFLFGLYLLFLLEISCHAYFAYMTRTSFLTPQLWAYFYPETHRVAYQPPIVRGDEPFDILLLGASVLHPQFGKIGEILERKLESRLKRPVRVTNIAVPAHTSRDSLRKYEALAMHRFDLVLFYHGINETRFNSCPPEWYQDNYHHIGWYARIDAIDEHIEMPFVLLPYTARFLSTKIVENYRSMGRMECKGPWNDYGLNTRTPIAFENNVRKIVAIAEHRGDPLLLMTFATHLPKGYDLDKGSKEQADGVNDYANGNGSCMDLWGHARGVMAAIESHNKSIRKVVTANKKLMFVDQARRIPNEGKFFSDVCHLSSHGCRDWVDNVVPVVAMHFAGSSLD